MHLSSFSRMKRENANMEQSERIHAECYENSTEKRYWRVFRRCGQTRRLFTTHGNLVKSKLRLRMGKRRTKCISQHWRQIRREARKRKNTRFASGGHNFSEDLRNPRTFILFLVSCQKLKGKCDSFKSSFQDS